MLGEALRQLRLFYGIKQKDLARRLGVSASYLSEIEKGEKPNISMDIIKKYSDVFRISPSYILLFSEKLQQNEQEIKINKNAAKKILNIMRWISEKREFADDEKSETV